MAQVVKRKAQPPPPERAPAPSESATTTSPQDANAPLSTVRAGAEEVREKLKEDLSRWMRVRRVVTLRPTIGCVPCDATGKTTCHTCDGSGRTQFILVGEDEAHTRPCATCEGTGAITCVECAGAGELPNVHRKKIMWILGLGVLAWLIVLWAYLGRDLLPEQRATLLSKGGGASTRPGVSHGTSLTPNRALQPGGGASVTTPGGTVPAPPTGGPAPPPPGPGAAGPGGAVDTQHGMSWHPPGR